MNFLLLILLILASTTSFAQDAKEGNLSLGAGITFKKNLRVNNTKKRRDKKIVWSPIPIIQASYGRFSIGGQGLSVMAVGSRFMNISAFINRGGDSYESDGMEDRKNSFFAGISGKFQNYSLSVSKDIFNKSKGMLSKISYGKMFIVNEDITILANAGIEWHDDRYADYYYGVRASEATATRAEYNVKNFFQPGIGFMEIIKMTEKISFMAGLNFKYVPKEVRLSPTMNGNKFEFGGLIGLSYKF